MYCGIDIIEVDRIKDAIAKNENFLTEVFSKNEINNINYIKSNVKYQKYATRFACKEAVFKAISKILKENNITFKFNLVEILNDENNRPYINFIDTTLASYMTKYNIDISLSHIKSTATAICIIT